MDKTSRKNSHEMAEGAKNADSRRTSNSHHRRQSHFSLVRQKSIMAGHGGILGMLRAGGHKSIKYENTYYLNPKPSERLNQVQLEELISDTFRSSLKNVSYNPIQSKTLAMNLSNLMRRKVHEFNTPSRYKFIVQVYIGPIESNSICIASRSLWNTEMGDRHAKATYESAKLFAVGLIFAVYFD